MQRKQGGNRMGATKGILIMVAVLAVLAGSFNTANSEVVTDGLVSAWTFNIVDNQTVRDVWGPNHGTLMGDTKRVQGKFGNALEFDGDGDYVDCGKDESLNFERDEPFSVEAWINPDRTAGAHMIVIGKMLSFGTYRGWALWYRGVADQDGEPNTMACILRSQNSVGNTMHGVTENTLPEEGWTHVVMTYDGSSAIAGLKCYVDGQVDALVKRSDGLSNTIKTDVSGFIGARNTEKGQVFNFFEGAIDEVRIYDKALSEQEVERNFEALGFDAAVETADKLTITWGEVKASN